MSRTSLIKLIHVARRDLQLDDDTYRTFLVQCTGKTSCRELSVAQLERVLDAMKERGFKKQKKHPRRRFKGHVTPREKIYKIWQQMFLDGFVSDISDAALDKYVERLTARRNGGQGVSTLAWCHGNRCRLCSKRSNSGICAASVSLCPTWCAFTCERNRAGAARL